MMNAYAHTHALLATFLADADGTTLGGGALAFLGAAALTAFLGWLRGIRPLAPIVAAIEWFRRDGARGFDLTRYGLSVELQAQIRADLQEYLWNALRDAIATLADKVGLLAAVDARVKAITEPLKKLEQAAGAVPVTAEEKAAALRKTTGLRPAVREDGNPFPTRPALLLALLLPLALATGCVAAAVHDAALTAKTATEQLHDSSAPDPAWLAEWTGKPDTRDGHAGETWTEASLTAEWKRLWTALENANAAIVRGTE